MPAIRSALRSQPLLLGVGLAILLLISASSIAMDVKARDDAAWVSQTLDVLNKMADLRLLVRAAESASRGFALTRDPDYATEFRDTDARIPAALAGLRAAMSENPAQRELLENTEPILTRRMELSRDLLRLFEEHDTAGIAAFAARAEGRAAMERLTAKLDAMTSEQQRLLAVRSAQSKLSGQLLLTLDLVGVALVLLLAAILTRGAQLSHRALASSLSATKAVNQSLEAEVALQGEHLGTAQSVLENTFNSIAEAVLVIDTKGTIFRSNPAAERLLGHRTGMTVADLWAVNPFFHPDGVTPLSFEESPSTVALGGQPLDRKEVVIRPADHRKPLHVMVSGRPLRDAAGELIGASLVVHDITEVQETERKLQQAQKLDAIGKLTGGVAHDFNNMLTVITISLEMLADDLKERPETLQWAALINQAADRCSELIQHLLAFARKQPLRPRNVDINNTILDIAKLLRPTLGEHIEIDSILTQEVATAHIDASQLASALINMAINARDAMPDGGKLLIETRNVILDEAYAQANADVVPGPYVMLAISDTGTGMSPAIRDQVFEPFFTTKSGSKGSGLGLSMVYGFVKQSGGHIRIYSEEGHGTTIRLYLPPASLVEDMAAPPIAQILSGNETILVVEDDPLVRDFVVVQLCSLGYKTIAAADGLEALAHVKRGADFDLLFTDVILPGGMNGRELSDEVMKRRPGTKLLYTSGYTDSAIIHHGRLDEGVLLLSKPYRKSQLACMVRKALGDAGDTWLAATG
jgi:PAS domain S-box-containing protein